MPLRVAPRRDLESSLFFNSVARSVRTLVRSSRRDLLQHDDNIVCHPRERLSGFVGEDRRGVTPVPIPNTEVKTLPPMILLSGKVGDRRHLGLAW